MEKTSIIRPQPCGNPLHLMNRILQFLASPFPRGLVAVLLLGAASCTPSFENLRDPSGSPAPESELHLLSFLFPESPDFHEVNAQRAEIRIRQVDGVFAERVEYIDRGLQAGDVIQVPSVPRLKGIRATVAFFEEDRLIASCQSAELDLTGEANREVIVPMACFAQEISGSAQPLAVLNPIVHVNPVVDLQMVWSPEAVVETLLAKVEQEGLLLSQEVLWQDQRFATLSLTITATGQDYDLRLAVVEKSSQGHVLISKNAVEKSRLQQFFHGHELCLTGHQLALERNGPALDWNHLPVTLCLAKNRLLSVSETRQSQTQGQSLSPLNRILLRSVLTLTTVDGETPLLDATVLELREPNEQAHAPFSPRHLNIRVASHNLENLWDDVADNTSPELLYDDYSAHASNYILAGMPRRKAQQAARVLVLSGLPDIVGFQELESAQNQTRSLEILADELRPLGYTHFALGRQSNDKAVSVTTAFASRYPISVNDSLRIDFEPEDLSQSDLAELRLSARDPQVVEVQLPAGPGKNTSLRIYNSHWKSKRGDSEISRRMRAAFAELIARDVQRSRQARPELDIIVMGDLNTDYREPIMRTHLKQTGDKRAMLNSSTQELYNLWFEIHEAARCSYAHSGERNCIDNMLVSDTLYDHVGVQIQEGSFFALGREELLQQNLTKKRGLAASLLLDASGTPFRWQIQDTIRGKSRYARHQGVGFSDHLPLIADFFVVHQNALSGEKLRPDEVDLSTGNRQTEAPSNRLDELVRPCTSKETFVPLETLINPFLPQFLGTCVRLEAKQDFAYEISREGIYQVAITLQNGHRIGLSTTHAYDRNQDFLRQVLQNALDDRVLYVHGRLGWSGGQLAVHIDNPETDLKIEKFEEDCIQVSDIQIDLLDLILQKQKENPTLLRGRCVGFSGIEIEIERNFDSVKQNQKIAFITDEVSGTAAESLLYMSAEQARAYFPQPGRYFASGYATLLFLEPGAAGLHMSFNGRTTGAFEFLHVQAKSKAR